MTERGKWNVAGGKNKNLPCVTDSLILDPFGLLAVLNHVRSADHPSVCFRLSVVISSLICYEEDWIR